MRATVKSRILVERFDRDAADVFPAAADKPRRLSALYCASGVASALEATPNLETCCERRSNGNVPHAHACSASFACHNATGGLIRPNYSHNCFISF